MGTTETARAASYPLEPIEVRETPQPPEQFSDRVGAWNYLEIPNETLGPETRPVQDNLSLISGVQGRAQGTPTISIRGSAEADRVLTLYNDVALDSAAGVGPPTLL